MIIGRRFVLTKHAEEKRCAEGIPYAWLEKTLLHPDKVYPSRGQLIYQRRVDRKRRVLKAVVDNLDFPNRVVTVYLAE